MEIEKRSKERRFFSLFLKKTPEAGIKVENHTG